MILLHGWPGDHTDFRHVVPLLGEEFDVVVPDLRGFGHSDKHRVDPPDGYSAAAQARSIVALIDELGLRRPVPSGRSWGHTAEIGGCLSVRPLSVVRMGFKITVARQRNAVSQGMALGLCMLERYEIEFDKLRVDLAFEHAWRDWPDRYKSQFSQVDTDLRRGTDAVWVMTHADERKQVTPLFWDWSSGKLTIHQRGDDWDSDDPNDVEYALSMVDGDVPLEGWVSLASEFLDDFDREFDKG